ncbi:LacI family DNA-binding transcriptional regulator [Streptomyces himalayensis]|uniref:LacI family DNA-binding transcriptional regulator n=1 Tax=Streptomyces himalayensis TaxID=2820085 RepID=UPI0028682656|nr:LacI family DNA-binding transcriptional regulator [Streptomyces himalayensis]
MSRAEACRRNNRPGRSGIRDVAIAAGVSITTVSDALNGKGRLPDATRRHVRAVADRLGYRASAAARTLRTGKSGLIGLTVTTYGDEPFTFTESGYFAEMARAATSAAPARGYALVILPATSRHDVWSNVALDGAVVIDPDDHDPVVTELVRQGLPVVSDGRPAGSLQVTAWVDNDHEAAVWGILDHLAAAGARAPSGPGTAPMCRSTRTGPRPTHPAEVAIPPWMSPAMWWTSGGTPFGDQPCDRAASKPETAPLPRGCCSLCGSYGTGLREQAQRVFLYSSRLGVPARLFLITPMVALLVIQLLTVEDAASPLAPL